MSSSLYHHVNTNDPSQETPYERSSPLPSSSSSAVAVEGVLSTCERQDSTLSASSSRSWSSSLESSSISSLSVSHKRQRWYAASLFATCTVLLFADQNLMSPNLTAIAHEFGFDDQQRDAKLGGDIALAFWVLGAPASIVVGCLGDTYNRTKLFALTVGIGEGACLLTYFCTTYAQLYACRAVTGFSIGGALPLIYSVVSDLFVAEHRHGVSAMVGIGSGLGISIGQGVAGYLGPSFGWRLPFLVISIPALLCALLVYLTVPDPERGGMERAVRQHRRRQQQQQQAEVEENDNIGEEGNGCILQSDHHHPSSALEIVPLDVTSKLDKTTVATGVVVEEAVLPAREDDDEASVDNTITTIQPKCDMRAQWATFQTIMTTPTVVLLMLQGAPGCLPWGIVNTYLNDFLSENRGMTVEYATSTVLMFGLGSFLGMVLGGAGGSYLYGFDKRYPSLFAGSMAILGCIPFWILLNYITAKTPFVVIAFVAVISGLLTSVTGPIVKATLQNVTFPETRGQAFALYNLFDDFGRGLGPVFLARMIGRMGDRTPAFNVGVLGWVVCGILNLSTFCTVTRDEDHVQAIIAARLLATKTPELMLQADENGQVHGIHNRMMLASDPPSPLAAPCHKRSASTRRRSRGRMNDNVV